MAKKHGRNYRGYVYPDPGATYETIDVCFKIPNHQFFRAAVRGQLRALTQFYSWYNDGNIDLDERWAVAKLFLNAFENTLQFGECISMLDDVRQSPTDPCILEKTIDDGDTWTPFASLLDCPVEGADSYQAILQLNLFFQEINAIKWDGTPQSINPNMPDKWSGDPETGDGIDALCMGVQDLIQAMVAIEYNEMSWRNEGFHKIFYDVIEFIGDTVGLGFHVTGTLMAGDSWEDVKAALSDPDAWREVACCMTHALRGANTTQATLALALNGCGFTPGTPEEIVRRYIARNLDTAETYYALIDAVGKAIVRVDVFNDLDCLCYQIGIVTFDKPLTDLGYSHEWGEVSDVNGHPLQSHRGAFWSDTYPYGRRTWIRINLTSEMRIKGVNFDYWQKALPSHDLNFVVKLYNAAMVELDAWDATWTPTKELWQNTYWYPYQDDVQFIDVDLKFNVAENIPLDVFLDNVRVIGRY